MVSQNQRAAGRSDDKIWEKRWLETPEEAEKSYWEYEKRYQKKQRDLQIAKMQKTDVMLGDYLEYWFENISVRELRQPREWSEHIPYII